MTNLTPLRNFLQESHCDLGDNAWRLADLVRTMRNKRFIDLGVRLGGSSAVLSIEADERKNQVCGCDLNYSAFFDKKNGYRFVSENYITYLADSVTLGKNWDEDPFDIIFIDTIHTREQVLAELYFWSNHLNKNGYFIFHDSHWDHTTEGDHIAGKEWRRVDEAITEFFDLPMNIMKCYGEYQTDDILLTHFPGSYGMTFVKVKKLDAIQKFKDNIDWKEVFDLRNELNDIHFNKDNPKFVDWNQDIANIENELIITP